jgi:dTDP-4-amino-4,6-dideoxygalactose transaminase
MGKPHLIRHSRPITGPEESTAVARALASGHHTRGPVTAEFERKLSAAAGVSHAAAVTSGTAALTLALRAVGASRGAWVLVPSLACQAVWHAVRSAGARPALYDGGYDGPAAGELAMREKALKARGQRLAAVVLVAPPDGMGEPERAAEGLSDGVKLIVDRCQQLGGVARTKGSRRAACEIFSFYATKCISTGTGGAVASDDEGLVKIVRALNTHDGHVSLLVPRVSAQFDDLRAAVGVAQLGKLGAFTDRRAMIAAHYDIHFAKNAHCSPRKRPAGGMVFRYLVDCGSAAGAEGLAAHLAAHGIEAKRPVWRPLHKCMAVADARLPLATAAWERHLSIPLYPALTGPDSARIVQAMRAWKAPVAAKKPAAGKLPVKKGGAKDAKGGKAHAKPAKKGGKAR